MNLKYNNCNSLSFILSPKYNILILILNLRFEAKDEDKNILNLREVRDRHTDTVVLLFEVKDKAENIFLVEDET